ncbi:MAG: hypothetical protein O3A85_13160 [Proteobacteria bacterium]|nr:hypothetical protein [Pseudomonadota bacterium]
MAKKPQFRAKNKLARYIPEEYRQSTKRASASAFIEDPEATKDGLSVNSLEIETTNQIAANYAAKFSKTRPVGVCVHTIEQYNTAAMEAGLTFQWDITIWKHFPPPGGEQSYEHNPKPHNDSHSLVKYTCQFNDYQEIRFATRMANKPRFKMV